VQHLLFSLIKDKVPTAMENAKKVRSYQIDSNRSDTKVYEMNPYTTVDKLLEAIKNISKAYHLKIASVLWLNMQGIGHAAIVNYCKCPIT
jgi:uncharacterized protein with HEPN domain